MYKNDKRVDTDVKGEPSAKKFKSSLISDHVESIELQEQFAKYWHNFKPMKTDEIEIIEKPYRICKISNFLKNDIVIDEIKNELKDVKNGRNDMDLYQFEQTEDLANVKSEHIAKLYKTFKSDVTNWMEKNTGIKLSGKISMSSATYSDTDYLLCHDDNMGDRRIAFVLYLSKNWISEDGGALDIFDTDENGQPNNIVRSLYPEYNSLVFFEVVDNSYHQVAEITSPTKLRLSINGWFHGPLRDSNKQDRPEKISKYFEPEHTEVDVVSYVSKIYLYETIVSNIQKTIEKDSFIYLPDFLLPEIYEALSVDVKSIDIKWEKIGPADLQNYELAREDTLPQKLKEFYNIFKSINIFHLLKQYTELDLVPETDEMKPKMKIELQRWSRGCYMLINNKVANEAVEKNTQRDTNQNENSKFNGDLKAEITKNVVENTLAGSKDVNSQTVGSNETISINPESEPVPEEKNLQKSNKDSKSLIDNESGKRKEKGKMCMSKIATVNCTNSQKNEATVIAPGETDSSDIGDYLSNPDSESESELSELDGEDKDDKPGTLDVILQFHTKNVTEDATIDYIDPSQKDGALIHIPPQDNHLCLVYRTADTCRCNKYVNHYCNEYFYTLVCSYYE